MEQFAPIIRVLVEIVPLVLILLRMQKQSLKKLDDLIDSNNAVKETLVAQSLKLEYGDREFRTISEHQKVQDETISLLREKIHDIRNDTITHEHLKMYMEQERA